MNLLELFLLLLLLSSSSSFIIIKYYVPGVYVANLTQHEVRSAGDVFALLEIGKQHLVIAETKMVRHSSRYKTLQS